MVQNIQRQQLSRQVLRQRASRQDLSRRGLPSRQVGRRTNIESPVKIPPIQKQDEFAITSEIQSVLNQIKSIEEARDEFKRNNPYKTQKDFRGSIENRRLKAAKYNRAILNKIKAFNARRKSIRNKGLPRWYREVGNYKKFE